MIKMICHEGFPVGKDNTVWFHDRQVGRNWIYEKMLEKFSSSNLQSCDGHCFFSYIYIHKNKLNWTCNCHAPAMAFFSKSHCAPYHIGPQTWNGGWVGACGQVGNMEELTYRSIGYWAITTSSQMSMLMKRLRKWLRESLATLSISPLSFINAYPLVFQLSVRTMWQNCWGVGNAGGNHQLGNPSWDQLTIPPPPRSILILSRTLTVDKPPYYFSFTWFTLAWISTFSIFIDQRFPPTHIAVASWLNLS